MLVKIAIMYLSNHFDASSFNGNDRAFALSSLKCPSYFQVYDITNEKSFENIKNWIRNIEEHASADVEKMILANKCDMTDRRQVKIQRLQN